MYSAVPPLAIIFTPNKPRFFTNFPRPFLFDTEIKAFLILTLFFFILNPCLKKCSFMVIIKTFYRYSFQFKNCSF